MERPVNIYSRKEETQEELRGSPQLLEINLNDIVP